MAGLLVLAACGGDGDTGAPAARPTCVAPSPLSDLADVPKQLQLHRHATITEIAHQRGALGITATSDQSVVELYPPLARAILDSGYSIVSSDNEGFEAEIFFGNDKVTGAYRLREAPCRDQVIVRLLFDDSSAGRR